jgi:UMF1 family MFS transporter
VRVGLRDLWETLKTLPRRPSILWYLIAHMVYIDGVNTLFVFGPLIAVGEFGFPEDDIMLLGVTIYVAAGLGAFAFGWLDDRIGSKTVVAGAIVAMLVTVVVILFIEGQTAFWVTAGIMSIFFGPVQASSRTLMIRISPEHMRVKLLGLYSLSGRATAPLGPALVGAAVLATDSQRAGIAVVAGLLVVGLLLLLPVREPPPGETAT